MFDRVMRSLFLDRVVDDELRMIAARYNLSKSDLIRSMVNHQLKSLKERINEDDIGQVDQNELQVVLGRRLSNDVDAG